MPAHLSSLVGDERESKHSLVFCLWTLASLLSQMQGSEMVPQAVPLHSPYAFVVFRLTTVYFLLIYYLILHEKVPPFFPLVACASAGGITRVFSHCL